MCRMLEIRLESGEIIEVQQRSELVIDAHELFVWTAVSHAPADPRSSDRRNCLQRSAQGVGEAAALGGRQAGAGPEEDNVRDHAAIGVARVVS